MATKNKQMVTYVPDDLLEFVEGFTNKSRLVNCLLRKLKNDEKLQKELEMVHGIKFNINKESEK